MATAKNRVSETWYIYDCSWGAEAYRTRQEGPAEGLYAGAVRILAPRLYAGSVDERRSYCRDRAIAKWQGSRR